MSGDYIYSHKSLRELRDILATRLGAETSSDATDQITKHLNEIIRASHQRAMENCQWVHAQRTVTFDIGTQQGEIPFPAGCGPGSILELGIWLSDADRSGSGLLSTYPTNVFVPLDRVVLGIHHDSDPLWDEGGDAMDRVTGPPRRWGVRDRILIRPLSDKPYPMKMLFTYAPELHCDCDRTVIDAELILLYAMSEYHSYEGEQVAAQRQERRAEQRLRYLRAAQATDQIIPYLEGINLRLSPDQESRLINPNDIPGFDFKAKGQTWDAAGIVSAP
jgi:hypothetical protein